MNEAALLTTLNIRIGDTDNFALTADEKTEALDEAINDHAVFKPKWDSSLTFSETTYQYAKPSGIDVLQDIYIRPTNGTDSEPEKIDPSLWEVVDTNIQFKNGANRYLTTNDVLFLRGKTKYLTSDTITETNLQEFVLNLAQLHCYEMMMARRSFRFLKNDTSMSEIIAAKRECERKIVEYRRRLPREFEAM